MVLSHQNTLEPQQPGICKPSLTTGLLAPEAKEEDGTVAFPGHAAWVPSGKLRRGRLRNQVLCRPSLCRSRSETPARRVRLTTDISMSIMCIYSLR